MADDNKLYFIASDICLSEQKSNDIFLLIEARLCSTRGNQNMQGVTQAFMDEVVNNQQYYSCMPLFCDKIRLLNGDHAKLGHMMNDDGQFGTTQIGAITSFKKQRDEYGASLIAQIRIPKRQIDVCENVMKIYSEGNLNFSFEVLYDPNYVIEKDGVRYVDAHEGNVLCGMCLVSVPAYPESTALNLIAELEQGSEAKGVENEMNQEQMEKAVAEAVAAKEEEMAKVIAEKDAAIAERDSEIAELNKAIAENPFAKKDEQEDKEDKEQANAECKKEQNAECDKKEANAECGKKDETAEKKEESCAECDPEKDKMKAEIEKLKAELESVNSIKAEYESMKAEKAAKELAENQSKAKSFAEKQGLDTEDETVAKAIAEVDYKMIAELSMRVEEDKPKKELNLLASFAGDGFEIKGGFEDMYAPASK